MFTLCCTSVRGEIESLIAVLCVALLVFSRLLRVIERERDSQYQSFRLLSSFSLILIQTYAASAFIHIQCVTRPTTRKKESLLGKKSSELFFSSFFCVSLSFALFIKRFTD